MNALTVYCLWHAWDRKKRHLVLKPESIRGKALIFGNGHCLLCPNREAQWTTEVIHLTSVNAEKIQFLAMEKNYFLEKIFSAFKLLEQIEVILSWVSPHHYSSSGYSFLHNMGSFEPDWARVFCKPEAKIAPFSQNLSTLSSFKKTSSTFCGLISHV